MGRCSRSGPAFFLVVALCASCDAPAFRAPRSTTSEPDASGLVPRWPRGGPPRLWARPLGPGYSGIEAEGGRLYTMYRSGASEVVIALDARSGETVWEHRYHSTPVEGQDTEYGEGPNARPLLADGRLYTIGFAGVLHCLEPATGAVLWSRDLLRELGATVVELGYSARPVEFEGTIIALAGGPGQGLVAFDKKDGRVVWRGLDSQASFASPALMTIHGEDQVVAFMATEVVGADPRTGGLLWRYAIRNQYPQNICAPIQIDGDLVFVSTTEAGSRGLRVLREGGFRVEEAWSTRRVQCFYGEFAAIGDTIYGTSGTQSGPRMSAIHARTGEIAWRVRGFRLSHTLAVGAHLVLLDDEGSLTLATPTSDGLEVRAEARVLSSPALTPPTILGTVLYARDQRRIVALELGPPAADSASSAPGPE